MSIRIIQYILIIKQSYLYIIFFFKIRVLIDIYIMNNIMDVHKLSINLDINRYIKYTLMYIGYECVGYVFIYTLIYSCIKPYK